MEPQVENVLNPKARSGFTGGLSRTAISMEAAISAQFIRAQDPTYFNKGNGVLFELDTVFNDRVIYPNLLAPFSISFSIKYSS